LIKFNNTDGKFISFVVYKHCRFERSLKELRKVWLFQFVASFIVPDV
jgi:hypothetical protein